MCCLLTKSRLHSIQRLQDIRYALHLQRLQHHTNGTQSPQHLQHTISTASTALLDSTSHHRETSKMAAQTPQTTGDFTNKQFSEQEVANKVIEQYSEATLRPSTSTSWVAAATTSTTACLGLPLMASLNPQKHERRPTTVGPDAARHEGPANSIWAQDMVDYPEIAQTFGCKVISFNVLGTKPDEFR